MTYPPHGEPRSAARDRGSIKSVSIAIVVAVVGVVLLSWFGPNVLGNPFKTETVDRSAPLVLVELRDLADYHAAQTQFEVVIDEEDDVRFLPSFIAGERVQYVAVGSVDGIVEFSGLGEQSIVVDEDAGSVSITLPSAYAGDPVIDIDQSRVINRDRGVLDRIGAVFSDNPTSEQELIQTAQAKMAAGVARTELLEQAEANTTKMLESLLGALGYENVTVTYVDVQIPANAPAPVTTLADN